MIIDLAGIAPEEFRTVQSSSANAVAITVADRVLAVTFHPSDRRKLTPGVGAQRRIRALAAMGFPMADLARRLRRPVTTLQDLPDDALIPTSLWKAISKVYDELSMTDVPPDLKVRDWARHEQGWATPLAWDDDEIDDPRAMPHSPRGALGVDEVAIERRLCGDRAVALSNDDWQVILELADRQQWPVERLADMLQVEVPSAHKRLLRYRQNMRKQAAVEIEATSAA